MQHLHDTTAKLVSHLKQKMLAIRSFNLDLNTNKNLHEEIIIILKTYYIVSQKQSYSWTSHVQWRMRYYESLLEDSIGPRYTLHSDDLGVYVLILQDV